MNKQKCFDCGAPEVQFFTESESFDYKGQSLTVDVEYTVCPNCGADAILPDQIKRNDGRVRDAWRKADGLLTGTEIADMRKKLGLTQQDAAKVFGGGINAFSKYERGEVIQSEGMDKLMRLALEDKPVHVFGWLRNHAGMANQPANHSLNNGYGHNVVPFNPVRKPICKVETIVDGGSEDFPGANCG